jgi:hypothetical protein
VQRIAKRVKNPSTLRGNASVDEAERPWGCACCPADLSAVAESPAKVRSSSSLRPRRKGPVSALRDHSTRSRPSPVSPPGSAVRPSRPECRSYVVLPPFGCPWVNRSNRPLAGTRFGRRQRGVMPDPSRPLSLHIWNGSSCPFPDLRPTVAKSKIPAAPGFPECRAFLAWRRGARSLPSGSGRKGRDGALKTDWTKPWHGGASYGDRMAPVMMSRGFRAGRSARLLARAAIMECAPGWRCAAAGTRRVRDALPIGSAARSSGGLVAASGPSQALRVSAGVMKCRRSGGTVWRA